MPSGLPEGRLAPIAGNASPDLPVRRVDDPGGVAARETSRPGIGCVTTGLTIVKGSPVRSRRDGEEAGDGDRSR